MTGLLIKVWAIDALWSLGFAFMTLGLIATIGALVVSLCVLDEREETRKSVFRATKKLIISGLVLILISVIAPSKETAKLLKIGVCAEYAINIAQSNESFGKISENLSDALVEVSDLIKIQCSDWKNELKTRENGE